MTPEELEARRHTRREWHKRNPGASQAARQRASEKRRERMSEPEYRERRRRMARNGSLKAKYGITIEDYEAMLESQDNLCQVCREREPTQVDHCHQSGKVRALLCPVCNTAIGVLERRAALIPALTAYIEEHNLQPDVAR